jgi:hypothetical protein
MKVNTQDKIVQAVIAKMDKRSLVGQQKYGQTMHNEITTNKKNLYDFLVDVQEEIMDALLYIEAARECILIEQEEAMLRRMDIIGQNGNDGLHYDTQEV